MLGYNSILLTKVVYCGIILYAQTEIVTDELNRNYVNAQQKLIIG